MPQLLQGFVNTKVGGVVSDNVVVGAGGLNYEILWANVAAGDWFFLVTSPYNIYVVEGAYAPTDGNNESGDWEIHLTTDIITAAETSVGCIFQTDFTPLRNLPLLYPGDKGLATVLNRFAFMLDEFAKIDFGTGNAPTSATATGTRGQIRYDSSDADKLHICVATDTWKYISLSEIS
jgi:hypothetical protein